MAFDADVLILLLQPSIDAPTDPSTQRPVEYVSERLAQLVADLTERDAGVIVPAPALAEVLVVPGADALELLKVIDKQAVQCKFYAPGTRISKDDLDSFISASARDPFTRRIVVDTGHEWGRNAKFDLLRCWSSASSGSLPLPLDSRLLAGLVAP